MFTGIIEELGTVKKVEKDKGNIHLTIDTSFTPELKIDQSIAHNGVCLTVISIKNNEYLSIMGPSGSGKSTMMNMIGCLDSPSSGLYEFEGEKVHIMDDSQLASIRNRKIGFVFQTFNLLPKASALHNVEIPLVYANIKKEKRLEMASNALISV